MTICIENEKKGLLKNTILVKHLSFRLNITLYFRCLNISIVSENFTD